MSLLQLVATQQDLESQRDESLPHVTGDVFRTGVLPQFDTPLPGPLPTAPSKTRSGIWEWVASAQKRFRSSSMSRTTVVALREIEFRHRLDNHPLYREIPQQELRLLASLAEPRTAKAGETICRAGELDDAGFYLVCRGRAELVATKRERTRWLDENETFGEANLVFEQAPTRTVVAQRPMRYFVVTAERFRAHEQSLKQVANQFMASVRRGQSVGLVPETIDQGLYLQLMQDRYNLSMLQRDLESSRDEFRTLFTLLIVSLCIFAFGLVTSQLQSSGVVNLMTNIISGITGLGGLAFLVLSRRPITEYGLTLKGWKKSLWSSVVVYTLPICLAVTVVKWLALPFVPGVAHVPFIQFGSMLKLMFYFGFAAAQEVVFRGVIQSCFDRFLPGKQGGRWSIALTSLMFGTFHLHFSIVFGVLTMVVGLFWGILYKRDNTLIGVAVSHFILGYWFLECLGARQLMMMLP